MEAGVDYLNLLAVAAVVAGVIYAAPAVASALAAGGTAAWNAVISLFPAAVQGIQDLQAMIA